MNSPRPGAVRPVQELRFEICQFIRDHGHLRKFARNDVIYSQGDAADAAYALDLGLVELGAVNDEGREVIFSFRTPGEFFGLSEIILAEPRTRSAVAREDTALWVMGSASFMDVLSTRADILLSLLTSTLDRVIRAEEMRAALRGRSAEDRVAFTLLSLARQAESSGRSAHAIELNLTHDKLSRLCDMSRQTVTTILDDFQRLGVLGLGSSLITLHDPQSLEQLIFQDSI